MRHLRYALAFLLLGCDAGDGKTQVFHMEQVPQGQVNVENWYPTRGGSRTSSAWFAEQRPLIEMPVADEDACLSFLPGEDPWAQGPCEESCTTGHYCGYDGQCHKRPGNLSAGTLTVATSDHAFELEFQEGDACNYIGCYREAPGTDQSHLVAPEAGVLLQAAGADFPAFSVAGVMPGHLEVTAPELVRFPSYTEVQSGESVDFKWTAGVASDYVHIEFFSLYGGAVLCRAVDDGAFTVPWAHLSRLPAGTNEVEAFLERRRTVRSVTKGGVVDLSLASVESGTFMIQP